MTVKLRDLVDACNYVSAGEMLDAEAYLCRATGELLFHSADALEAEKLPDDIDDEDKYLAIPDKRDLDLGTRLVFRFVREQLPDDEDTVSAFFRRPGAYSRYKNLLAQRDALDRWFAYEEQATLAAMKEWCEENAVEFIEP